MEIKVFEKEEFGSIRTFEEKDGTALFCAKDVATALGYSNSRKAVADHCKGVTKRYPLRTSGGTQEFAFISAPDVMRLVVSSRLPGAQRFEAWVFEEVLPAIRRTGGYVASAPDEAPEQIMARALLVAQETIERHKADAARLAAENAAMTPKAGYFDALMDGERWQSVTEAARYLHQMDGSITRARLFSLLKADGMLTRDNQATKLAIDRGYLMNYQPPAYVNQKTGEQERPKPYGKVTSKGLRWMVGRYCKAA